MGSGRVIRTWFWVGRCWIFGSRTVSLKDVEFSGSRAKMCVAEGWRMGLQCCVSEADDDSSQSVCGCAGYLSHGDAGGQVRQPPCNVPHGALNLSNSSFRRHRHWGSWLLVWSFSMVKFRDGQPPPSVSRSPAIQLWNWHIWWAGKLTNRL